MKKNWKKLIAVFLTVITCATGASIFTACGPTSNEEIDTSRKQLYVWTYNGGYGSTWLHNAKAAYEAINKDVQVMITDPKTSGFCTPSNIQNQKYELYFGEGVDFYTLIKNNAITDVNEAVTTANQYDGGKTILSKMTEQQKDYYFIGEEGTGKYYGLPHYAGNYGITYNKTLFNDKCWYFNSDVTPTNLNYDDPEVNFVSETKTTKSAGPDGEIGTYDDGLPATYEQFFFLCDYIAATGGNVKPVTWTGKYANQYLGYTISAAIADNEGRDQYALNYSFDGTATTLGHVEKSGNDYTFIQDQTPTQITAENGNELARQRGKYEALAFFDKLTSKSNVYFDKVCYNTSDEQTMAQLRLIRGQAAMLFEGVWWQNEATFSALGKTKYDYDFAWMPFPKSSADKVGTTNSVMLDCMHAPVFIKAGISEEAKARAIDFIKFCYSDAQLDAYTQATGTFKAVSYEITQATKDKLTTYEKSLYEHKQACDLTFDYSGSDLYFNHETDFNSRYVYATVNGTEYDSPVKYLLFARYDKSLSVSAAEYFNGMKTHDDAKWVGYNK